jgi:hypothetical protein
MVYSGFLLLDDTYTPCQVPRCNSNVPKRQHVGRRPGSRLLAIQPRRPGSRLLAIQPRRPWTTILGRQRHTGIPKPPESPLADHGHLAILRPEVIAPQSTFKPEIISCRDPKSGFEFDHPTDWRIGFQESQSRGNIVQFQDATGPRLDVVVLLWDPKRDLPAYLEVRRSAFESSGIIVKEKSLTLGDGQEAVTFLVEGVDGNQGFFFISTLHDRYLQLSGSGDLELLGEIAQRVRVFEIVEERVEGEPSECFTVTEEDQLWVPCNVIESICSRNLAAGPSWMADPFITRYWGSEGREDTPFDIIDELQSSRLPADPSLPMTFTLDREAFPSLGGMPVEVMFGPVQDVAFVIYSEGWGLDGQSAALLYFAEDAEGDL